MKNLILLIALTTLWIDNVVQAADSIICYRPNGEIESVEPLEIFEAQHLRGLDFVPTGAVNTADAFEVLVSRIRPAYPENYKSFVDRFFESTRMIDGILIDRNESKIQAIRRGCQPEQVMIEQLPRYLGDTWFVIQKQRWQMMTTDQQAVLLAHWAFKNSFLSHSVDWLGLTKNVTKRPE